MTAYDLPVDEVALHARLSPDRIACIDCASGERLSYSALHKQVDDAAAWLHATLPDGARVAWLGRNSAAMLIAHLACSRSGRVFVPLNWRLAARELAVIIEDCEPELILAAPEFHETLHAAVAQCGVKPRLMDALGALENGALPEQVDPEKPSVLLYTSGTTGRPKGVIHSERTIHFSAMNMVAPALLDTTSRFLCDLPLFHVMGLFVISRSTLKAGGTLLLSSGFDPDKTLERLADVTHYCAVPQILDQLRLHPDFPDIDFSRLKAICVGGAPISGSLLDIWLDRGAPLANGFGMSEAGVITLMPAADRKVLRSKAGSCGKALAATKLRIADADGVALPPGTPGELWVRGANIAAGYWRRPDDTAAAFSDGWMRTGDIAMVDDEGFYTLLDRKKDMFISGGENVYPAEVEAAISGLTGIRDVAVIGVEDERWGEVGCAFVVGDADQETVLSHCRAMLAKYKVPRHVISVDQIPRNASGKALKNILREWAAEGAIAATSQ